MVVSNDFFVVWFVVESNDLSAVVLVVVLDLFVVTVVFSVYVLFDVVVRFDESLVEFVGVSVVDLAAGSVVLAGVTG